MGTKERKDLEIIYNLQWKNGNSGDKANIIGMYDIPATTLNWEVFKSYLLKNSGTVGDDVKVSYITDSNREFPIESQTDFQIALYAFRRKARLGDIVNLKLDRISGQPMHKNLRHSNDVETQSEHNEAVSLTSTCCNIETPPEWFITYMGQFKKNITEELIATVSGIVSNIKPHVVSQPSCYHSRKSKSECPKRSVKKLPTLIGEPSYETKDLFKSLKMENKLERKLEKLEHKTKKIKVKKLALLAKSSDSDAGQSSSRSHSYSHSEIKEDVLQMNAAPVNLQSAIPHMLGGEVYLHQWEVMNTGKLPWTSKTTLNFTWGSKALKPLDSVISVPYLKPGEIGTLAVRLQIPDCPGQYECYWHFHHKGKRFGHWLGCQVIVDPFDLKGNKSVLETSFVSEFISNPKKFKSTDVDYHIDQAVTQYSDIFEEPATSGSQKYAYNIEQRNQEQATSTAISEEDQFPLENGDSALLLVRNLSSKIEDITFHDPTDTNCSSDSDNQSIISLSESNSSKSVPEEFVLVPIPDCFKIDQFPSDEIIPQAENLDADELVTDSAQNVLPDKAKEKAFEGNVKSLAEGASYNFDDNNNSEKTNQNPSGSVTPVKADDSMSSESSHKSDIVLISIPNKEEQDTAGFAYLIVDGRRLPIPKKILNSEYLKMADEGAGVSRGELTRTNSIASSIETNTKKDESLLQADTVNTQDSIQTSIPEQQIDADQKIDSDTNSELMSHCSAAGSCFSEVTSAQDKNSRLFIFPQTCPGFEVVYPVLDVAENNLKEYKWSESDTQYAFANSAPQSTTAASAPPLNPTTSQNKNPFTSGVSFHVPNYQQTPPDMRTPPPTTTTETINVTTTQPTMGTATREIPTNGASDIPVGEEITPENVRTNESSPPIHILPETLVSGAVNVASSALNTARTVINMIVPREPGNWVNGHWVSASAETPREANLHALAEMGFWNRDLNATLLARYNDDLSRVVAELVQ